MYSRFTPSVFPLPAVFATCLLALFVLVGGGVMAQATITVCPAGSSPACDFTTIQAAVDDSPDNIPITITIAGGNYPEGVSFDTKQIKLEKMPPAGN